MSLDVNLVRTKQTSKYLLWLSDQDIYVSEPHSEYMAYSYEDAVNSLCEDNFWPHDVFDSGGRKVYVAHCESTEDVKCFDVMPRQETVWDIEEVN